MSQSAQTAQVSRSTDAELHCISKHRGESEFLLTVSSVYTEIMNNQFQVLAGAEINLSAALQDV